MLISYGWCSLRAKRCVLSRGSSTGASFSVLSSSRWAPPPGTVSLAVCTSACIQTSPPNVTTGSESWVLQLTFLDVLVFLCFVLYGQFPNYISFGVSVCMLWNLRISLGNVWLWLQLFVVLSTWLII